MSDVVPLTGSPVRGALSVRLKRSLSALKPLLPLGALLAGVTAFAQTTELTALPRLELERLTLNPAGTGSLVLSTGEVLRKGGYRLSLTGHYEHNPLVSYVNGTREGSVVAHRATSYLAGAYGITDRLEISAQVPVLLTQQGKELDWLQRPAGGMALGTPYVGVRLGLLQQQGSHGVDLALGLNAGLPLGSAESLAQDSTLRAIPSVMVGRDFGPVRAGVDAGVLVRAKTLVGNTEVNDTLRLGAVVSTGKKVRGELNVLGHIPLNSNEPKSLEALAGARLNVSSAVEAYALAGVGFGRMPGTPDFRGLLGVAYSIGGKQAGNSRRDNGPDTPTPSVSPMSTACEREGKPDSDCDQLEDENDICPTVPGLREFQGCPAADIDKDGLQNSEDKCPTLPGPKQFQGCPDSDQDGLQDSEDKCPFLQGPRSNQGCPEPTGQRGKLTLPPVHFETNKAVIHPDSYAMLNDVVKLLNDHSEYNKIWIEGHTDSDGSETDNLELSKRRAAAVRTYLIDHGVNTERLEAQGFGEQFSVASNETEDGKSLNRRVEFFTRPRELPTTTSASPPKPRGSAPKARRAPTTPRTTQQR